MTIIVVCNYICYGVLTLCAYLVYLLKFLQLPYGIICIQVTCYSIP